MNKNLIINADDFWMSPIYNKAILELLSEWSITSTSVMMSRVSQSQENDIYELKRLRDIFNISVWLHVEFFDTRFVFHLERQLTWFIKVFGHWPDHLDLHASTYKDIGYPHIAKKALEIWVPCRYYDWLISQDNIATWENISWSKLSLNQIQDSILSSGNLNIELVLHPGYVDDWYITSMVTERVDDIKKSKNLVKFAKINWINLICYRDLH